MPRALVFASFVACVFAAMPATLDAQTRSTRMRFAAMDRNGDGIISRDEWQGSDRSFEVHDWNGDGELSGPEVAIGQQRQQSIDQADHLANRVERNLNWTAAGFNNLDHNRDRRITPNEWHYDMETFHRVDRNGDGALTQAEFLGDPRWDDDRGDNFDDLDANNDGRIERREWHGGLDVFSQLDRNRDGVLSRYEVVGNRDVLDDRWDQFSNLDADRSGTIERDEWHASLGSFNRRDLNRDGVLSRREFDETAGADIAPVFSGSRTVHIDPKQRWGDTGIEVRAGDTITFDASGTIRMSDNGEDLADPSGARSGRKAADAPILNQPAGSLIGRIGDYGPFLVGGRRSIVARASGRLYLGVNDDHLPDNTGEYVVTIGVERR